MKCRPDKPRSRRIGTGVLLTLFFLTLLAVNAAFFAIAMSNPPDEIAPPGATPAPVTQPQGDAGAPGGDG